VPPAKAGSAIKICRGRRPEGRHYPSEIGRSGAKALLYRERRTANGTANGEKRTAKSEAKSKKRKAKSKERTAKSEERTAKSEKRKSNERLANGNKRKSDNEREHRLP
jgi:hypothetical protein